MPKAVERASRIRRSRVGRDAVLRKPTRSNPVANPVLLYRMLQVGQAPVDCGW